MSLDSLSRQPFRRLQMTFRVPAWLLLVALSLTAACTPHPDAAELRRTGLEYKNKGDYEKALEQFNAAILLRPDDPSLLNTRGTTYQFMDQYDRAVEDFDRAIALQPAYALAIKNRGRTHFYLGHFAAAEADLRRGSALDSANLFMGIWIQLAAARQGRDATNELKTQLSRADSATWPAPIARYLLKQITVEQLDSASEHAHPPGSRTFYCPMFYEGEQLLSEGHVAEATRLFEDARDHCVHAASEYHGSFAELQRLRAPAR
ncbi:MAG TPA: tetratricopeptide repeat protein [Gemmatimonadaceae bacterium]|jgi:lipoprotein NlpI|nr:tetratricopeptide repeat protein [Gemmatimonadaceae bacterium]